MSIFAKINRKSLAIAFFALAAIGAISIGTGAPASAAARNLTWRGMAETSNPGECSSWNNGSNWSVELLQGEQAPNHNTPQNGDTLIFPSSAVRSGNCYPVNTFTNLTVSAIIINGDSAVPRFIDLGNVTITNYLKNLAFNGVFPDTSIKGSWKVGSNSFYILNDGALSFPVNAIDLNNNNIDLRDNGAGSPSMFILGGFAGIGGSGLYDVTFSGAKTVYTLAYNAIPLTQGYLIANGYVYVDSPSPLGGWSGAGSIKVNSTGILHMRASGNTTFNIPINVAGGSVMFSSNGDDAKFIVGNLSLSAANSNFVNSQSGSKVLEVDITGITANSNCAFYTTTGTSSFTGSASACVGGSSFVVPGDSALKVVVRVDVTTAGYIDTYLVTYSDGSNYSFTVDRTPATVVETILAPNTAMKFIMGNPIIVAVMGLLSAAAITFAVRKQLGKK